MAKTGKKSGPEKTAKKSNSSMNPGDYVRYEVLVTV